MFDARETLDSLIRRHNEDYASISKLLGRNPAYIQQYIRRGVPRKLDEEDRRLLANYFGVHERELGAPNMGKETRLNDIAKSPFMGEAILIPRLNVQASAGSGVYNDSEISEASIGFDARWLKLHNLAPNALSMIRVQGDSMLPTLAPDDEIMVNTADRHERLRDGIYVLRIDDVLWVKRLAVNPLTHSFIVKSDNLAYPEWKDCDVHSIDIIGRVVWTGRKL
jgi:phage repressor protein C with HTH and peptisase S24 domain